MKKEFQSSITRGGNVLTPDKITITDSFVIWSKRNKFLIGVDSISIPRDKISGIEIKGKLWGADIYINSFGGTKITAKNFVGSDAKRIKEILSK
jgi:hypothetical protein